MVIVIVAVIVVRMVIQCNKMTITIMMGDE